MLVLLIIETTYIFDKRFKKVKNRWTEIMTRISNFEYNATIGNYRLHLKSLPRLQCYSDNVNSFVVGS